MADIPAIIARCTRNGVTSWQNVAQQTGQSLDAVRRLHDRNYLPVRPWPHYCEEVTLGGEVINENETSSLAQKGGGMRIEIAMLLKRHGSLSVSDIAGRLNRPANSVRMRLSRMKDDGWAENDSFGRGNGGFEWTWKLTEQGLRVCANEAKPAA